MRRPEKETQAAEDPRDEECEQQANDEIADLSRSRKLNQEDDAGDECDQRESDTAN
jgi:hypothetical protein